MPEPTPSAGHPDIAGYLLGLLPDEELAGVGAHIDRCPDCARDLAELGHLPALLARAAPTVEPPEDLGRRVLDAVRREPRPAGWRRRLSPGARRRPAGSRLRLPPAAALPPVSARWLIAGAVGALLVAVGILQAAGLLPISWGRAQPPGAAAPPQVQTVRLVAVDGSTGSGTARIERTPNGRMIELTVNGLSANPPGKVYVCWMVGSDAPGHPERIAVGRFSVSGQEQPKTLRWKTTETMGQYRIGVTLEPDDGGQARRGPQVLREV